MIRLKLGRALLAGIAGTAAMTALMWMAPAMGFPSMNIGEMLGSMKEVPCSRASR
jgi:hypothetical protein